MYENINTRLTSQTHCPMDLSDVSQQPRVLLTYISQCRQVGSERGRACLSHINQHTKGSVIDIIVTEVTNQRWYQRRQNLRRQKDKIFQKG